MKINWGWSIVIAIVSFMGFILYFVIKVQTNSEYDNELVVEDYYKQEVAFQQTIDKKQNAANLTEKINITSDKEGIHIHFPTTMDYEKIKGKVSLYRPSNQKLDSEKIFSLSSSHLLIPKSELVSGRWDISIDWNYNDQEYLNKETIYF